jgi:hemoglobin
VSGPSAPTQLFERAGGREGVRGLVERFYELVECDEVLRPVYPDDLEPGKEKLALFFEQWLGGPQVYSERYGHPRLRRRHFPFVIDDVHAGRWLRHMRRAMQDSGWSDEDIAAAYERLAPLAHHMVNAKDDVPREPIQDDRLS